MDTSNTQKTYRVRLKTRREVAERTLAFYFEKPNGFLFQAGQFVDLTLLDPPETDSEGNVRTFTIASAPSEDDLMVATRLRDSAFKRVLRDLPLEASVKIEGPSGNLTLPENSSRPLFFLAGGIGITPFRSMVIEAAMQSLSHRLTLFYANRRPEDAPFLQQLQNLQQKNANYTFVGSMTNLAESSVPWSGETGYLTYEMLTRYVQGDESPVYYIVGPPAMVRGMRVMLDSAGVSKSDIKTEEFAGY